MSAAATEIDVALPTFVAESRELLQEMEAALLQIEQGTEDAESINALFRAAHTIKGSSGLFGLSVIVGFTHTVESVLDRLRSGALAMQPGLAGILLECCDHMSRLVNAVEQGGEAATLAHEEAGRQLLARLSALAGQAVAAASSHEAPAACAAPTVERRWKLQVQFHADVFRNGMDPLSFIRYLGTLGEISGLAVLDGRLPTLDEFDPESCYLGFELQLRTAAEPARIEGAFEFVKDDCTLNLEPLDPPPALPEAVTMLPTAAARAPAAEVRSAAGESRGLRVDGEKLDRLIDLIGELVTAGAATTLEARKAGLPALNEASQRLGRLVEEVRDEALKLRMVQIAPTFARFQRIVRDAAREVGKPIRLEVRGGDTELDKTLVERITDPLTHLVRNSIDHGIEPPELRLARNKDPEGLLQLNAYHESGSVVVEVVDDGGGLNRERIAAKAVERGLIASSDGMSDAQVHALIFEPGFSTAEKVSNLSGRGVGMDVVKRNVTELRGSIELLSREGEGTTIRIRLPLTLAIIDGFLVRSGASFFVIPLELVEECIALETPPGQAETERCCLNLRGTVLPFVRLRGLFSLNGPDSRRESIVVLRAAGRRFGIVVDELLGEMQAVVKPLSRIFSQLRGIGGSTILGTGQLALIVDAPSLLEHYLLKQDTPSQAISNQQVN